MVPAVPVCAAPRCILGFTGFMVSLNRTVVFTSLCYLIGLPDIFFVL